MLSHYHAIRGAAARIAKAVNQSVAALREGRVEQEPAMTDRMLGAIEHSLEGYRRRGILWNAKTLTDHGPNTQERDYGADFVGALNISLPDYTVSKGFLAQAKLVKNGRVRDLRDLRGQCERMLNMSADSFVFLYDTTGVRIVPAISVVASGASPTELYSRSAARFFEEHLQCFFGDRGIQSATPQTLKELRLRFEARNALLIEAQKDDNTPE